MSPNPKTSQDQFLGLDFSYSKTTLVDLLRTEITVRFFFLVFCRASKLKNCFRSRILVAPQSGCHSNWYNSVFITNFARHNKEKQGRSCMLYVYVCIRCRPHKQLVDRLHIGLEFFLSFNFFSLAFSKVALMFVLSLVYIFNMHF